MTLQTKTAVPAGIAGRGRDSERLADLLTDKSRVVVHGPAGIGKSALLGLAAERLRSRGVVERAVSLRLASGAGRGWVTDVLGLRLYGPGFTRLPADRRPLVLLKAVTERPTLLLFEQLDRVAAPPWSEGGDELNPVLELGVELTQAGRTRLAVETRRPDLGYAPYAPSRRVASFAVPPLGEAEAGEVAERTGAGARRAAAAVAAAAGNPLALRLRLETPGDAQAGEAAADPLAAALGDFRRSFDATGAAALDALAALRDGGLLDCAREVAGVDAEAFARLVERLAAAGAAAVDEVDGAPAHGYLHLQDALGEYLRGDAGRPGAAAAARHRDVYLRRSLAWGSGGDEAELSLVLRELPNLLFAWAAGLEDGRDLVAAAADALQERLDRGAAPDATLIARTIAIARANGCDVPRSAS